MRVYMHILGFVGFGLGGGGGVRDGVENGDHREVEDLDLDLDLM